MTRLTQDQIEADLNRRAFRGLPRRGNHGNLRPATKEQCKELARLFFLTGARYEGGSQNRLDMHFAGRQIAEEKMIAETHGDHAAYNAHQRARGF